MLTYEEIIDVVTLVRSRILDLDGRMRSDADNPYFGDWLLEKERLQSAEKKLAELRFEAYTCEMDAKQGKTS